MNRRTPALLATGLAISVALPFLIATVVGDARQRDAFELVRLAATAHERVDYAGEIAWNGHGPDRAFVEHEAASGATYYSWGHRVYVRTGPSARMPDPAAWCLDIDALEESYRASEEAPGTFLQRPVRRFVLEPVHDGRPRIHLTVDVGTGLPLEATSYAPDGDIAHRASFRSVSFQPQQIQRTVSDWWVQWRGKVVSETEYAAAAPQRLEPAHLPAGFRCIERRIRGWETVYATRVFSDGATAFEIEQAAVATPEQMRVALTKKLGAARAERTLEQILEYRRRAGPPPQPVSGADAVVTREEVGRHTKYKLEVEGFRVTLTARSDLDPQQVTHVLRSLRLR